MVERPNETLHALPSQVLNRTFLVNVNLKHQIYKERRRRVPPTRLQEKKTIVKQKTNTSDPPASCSLSDATRYSTVFRPASTYGVRSTSCMALLARIPALGANVLVTEPGDVG